MNMIVKAVRTAAFAGAALCAAWPVLADEPFYTQHNLVSDGFVAADHTDANLVNAWGIVFNPTGPAWIANNNSGTSTLYDGNGVAFPPPPAKPLVVKIPGLAGAAGTPTGIVFNNTKGFAVSENGSSGASAFIFATEDGLIAGWSPGVDLNNAIVAIDSSASGAVYKGLAITGNGSGAQIYVTNFHAATIEVYDGNFKPVVKAGAFVDKDVPRGFAPFGIQAIAGDLYVTYAKQNAQQHDDVAGPGLGLVDVYDPDGRLLRRLASGGPLNAPWGLALAPDGFGELRGSLLVGNFGDGRIHAYDLHSGRLLDTLEGENRRPIVIDGLWGLSFGNGFASAPVDTLYFTAGPGDEQHGLFGRIDAKGGGD